MCGTHEISYNNERHNKSIVMKEDTTIMFYTMRFIPSYAMLFK